MLPLQLHLKSCLWHLVPRHVISATAFEVMLVEHCASSCYHCNCIWSHSCDTLFPVLKPLCHYIWNRACDTLFPVTSSATMELLEVLFGTHCHNLMQCSQSCYIYHFRIWNYVPSHNITACQALYIVMFVTLCSQSWYISFQFPILLNMDWFNCIFTNKKVWVNWSFYLSHSVRKIN